MVAPGLDHQPHAAGKAWQALKSQHVVPSKVPVTRVNGWPSRTVRVTDKQQVSRRANLQAGNPRCVAASGYGAKADPSSPSAILARDDAVCQCEGVPEGGGEQQRRRSSLASATDRGVAMKMRWSFPFCVPATSICLEGT